MTETKQLVVGGKALSEQPFHYRACGLDDVYLLNGFELEETEDGQVVTIHNIDGLHDAIATGIIMLPRPIRPREFRFLRKTKDQTQAELAQELGVDAQTVARYEKDQAAIPAPTDFMLRVGFLLHKLPENERAEMLGRLYPSVSNPPSGKVGQPLKFRELNGNWDGVDLAN